MLGIMRRHQITSRYVTFFLLAGICNMLSRVHIALLSSTMFCLNFAIYVGLLMFWMNSVRLRLLPTRSRTYILAAGVGMLFNLLVRTYKYRAVAGAVAVSRYLDYSYWIPMTLIPVLFLMTAMRAQRGNETEKSGREALMLIPAILLILMAMTNDFHSWVYIPKGNMADFTTKMGTYSYGWGCYLLYAWMICIPLWGLVILIRITRRRPRKILAYILMVLSIWIFLELLLFFVAEPFNLPRFYNSPELRIFGMLAIFEVCIRSRLILYNENYFGFFAGLNQPVLITDRSIKHVFQTALSINASEDALRASIEAPVYLNEDTKLCGMELGAGYAFWTEDETQLHKENRRLESANEILSQENELIEVENKLKEKKTRLDAESAIYQRIAAAIRPKQDWIEEMLSSVGPEDADFPNKLAQCCVLNAWSKRKSNLLLLSGTNLPKKNRELFLALQESARFLNCCGVKAAAVGEEYTDFPLSSVNDLYDTFETVIEAYLPIMKYMTVSLTADGIRMAMEADGVAVLPATVLPVECRQEDETVYMTIRRRRGGELA